MASFKHDSQGFLVGELLDVNRDLLDAQGSAMTVWRGIHTDVKAIARALGAQLRSPSTRAKNTGTSQSGSNAQVRDSLGRFTRRVETPAGRSSSSRTGQASKPVGGAANASNASNAANASNATSRQNAKTETSSVTAREDKSRTVATPGGRSARGRFIGAGTAGISAAPDSMESRDSLGRFTAGSGRGGRGAGGSDGSGTGDSYMGEAGSGLTNAIEKLGLSLDGADQIDPGIAALKEVQEVLSPVGRGLGMMFGANAERNADRKKEAWYKRLIKAIKGKKEDSPISSSTSSGDDSSGLMGGLTALVTSRLLPFLGAALLAVGVAVAVALGLLGGLKLGELIYKWLDESGLLIKIFDAIDSMKKAFSDAGDWIKTKYEGAKTVVKDAISNFNKGVDEKQNPQKFAPPVLDASGRNINDPRRIDRIDALNSDGTKINDQRRIDAVPENLPPSTSMAQSTGRFVGWAKKIYQDGLDTRNTPATSSDGIDPQSSFSPLKRRSLKTGADYVAGNIGGLSDAQTRALVASTVMTESSGGNLGAVNSAGYIGRYQAGARWLSDAGLIKGGANGVNSAMKKDGFTNEYEWGKSGKMTDFLKKDKSWTSGMNYEQYMGSAEIQDKAFKTVSESAYKSLMANPSVTDKSPENIAGLLKARHIAGMVGAVAINLNKDKEGPVDANGTSTRKYYDDVAKDKNGFLSEYLKGSTVSVGSSKIPTVNIPSSTPERIAPMQEAAIPTQINTAKPAPVNISMRDPIGQDVGDRSIAHVVSGGLGMFA